MPAYTQKNFRPGVASAQAGFARQAILLDGRRAAIAAGLFTQQKGE
jgi:hypothetical protein